MLHRHKINRGVGQPLEFRGLKAQYFGRFVALSLGMLVMWGILHVLGFPFVVAVLLALVPGGIGLRRLYRMSNIYGQFGLMKRSARRNLPAAMVSRSRRVFIELRQHGKDHQF